MSRYSFLFDIDLLLNVYFPGNQVILKINKIILSELGLNSQNNGVRMKGCTHCATNVFDGMCFD